MFVLRVDDKESEFADPAGLIRQIANETVRMMRKGNERAVVMKAATGVGKSTHYVAELFNILRSDDIKIFCSQLTIQNTIGTAQYVAKTYDLKMQRDIGYQSSASSEYPDASSYIVYQTQKITTNTVLRRALTGQFKHPEKIIVILDEIHADSIQTQEQLAYAKMLVERSKKGVKIPFLILQSASIDVREICDYIGVNQSLSIRGMRHPIVELHLDDLYSSKTPLEKETLTAVTTDILANLVDPSSTQYQLVASQLKRHKQQYNGVILVFFSKTKWILQTAQLLQKRGVRVPVYQISAQLVETQPGLMDKVRNGSGGRIILSTNFLETGFTIPDVTVCIDTLKFKSVSYDPLRKLEIAKDLPICKNMQEQRRGRVGRTQPGAYIAIAYQNIAKQLMDRREYQIQISDLKPLILDMGLSVFKSIKFIAHIPEEHILDYQQYEALYGLPQLCKDGLVKWFLTNSKLRMDLQYRILFLISMQQGVSGSDVLLLISALQNREVFKPELRSTSQFNEILSVIKQQPFSQPMQPIMKLYGSFVNVLLARQINVYSGAPIANNQSKFNYVLKTAFHQNIFKLQQIVGKQMAYVSRYGIAIQGPQVESFIDKKIEQVVTNRVYCTDKGVQMGIIQALSK